MTRANSSEQYENHREATAEKSRDASRDSRNIGPPPPCLNPARREAARVSLRSFCDLYLPHIFALPWSPDHLQVLAKTDEVILHGGLEALAMPRGGGKTSIMEAACLRATLYGLHAFLMLLAVSATRAAELLESIKTQLLTNDLLMEDFAEVCHPIRALEDRANRAKGQHIDGQPTFIGWRKTQVVFPAVRQEDGLWFPSSGTILRVAGMTSGGVRGPKFTRPHDGKTVRPSLVLIDDPQDDESASSPYQCEKLHKLVHGAVLGMAGPGKKISAVLPGTVIARDDFMQRMLNRQLSPLWHGQTYKLLSRFPKNMELWEEYAELRNEEFRRDGDGSQTTIWYGRQRALMDEGALVAWPERFKADELGPVQHAMNLLFLNPAAFWSEYQNEPQPDEAEGQQLQVEELIKRLSGLDRGVVPLACSHLTAYIDVHDKALYWLVLATTDGFSGSIISYGTYPDQRVRSFALSSLTRTLAREFPKAGLEGRLHAGLTACADMLLDRDWQREDHSPMKIEKCPIDAHWGESTNTVNAFCRTSKHSAIVMPSHGQGLGPNSKPWNEYAKREGERLGDRWRIPPMAAKDIVRKLLIDTNHWKSFASQRLTTAVGDRGAITLYGHKPEEHRLLAEHFCSERKHPTEGKRKIDEWILSPGQDNHWWDCYINSCCAASIMGVVLAEATANIKRTRVKSSDQYYAKHGGRPPGRN